MTSSAEPALPARSELGERTVLALRPASWRRPAVLLVEWGRGRAVVKDFAPCAAPVRWTLGRWLVRRELRAYRRLRGHPAVPRLLGAIDSLAFAVEHRAGTRFSRRRPWTFSRAFCCELAGAVCGLHARGVVHLDLRHRSNVRAGTDGRPVLIDFASAWVFRPGSWAARLLVPLLARVDQRALAKWRAQVQAGPGRSTSELTARSDPDAPLPWTGSPRPPAGRSRRGVAAPADPRSGGRPRV